MILHRTFDQTINACIKMAYGEMFPQLTSEWDDDFDSKCPATRHLVHVWENSLKQNGYISKVDIFLSDGQYCIFFSRLVRDIDLIPFES